MTNDYIFLASQDGGGGAENVIKTFALGFSERGVNTLLVNLRSNFFSRRKIGRLNVISLGKRKARNSIFSLGKILIKNKKSKFICSGPEVSIVLYLSSIIFFKKIIFFIRPVLELDKEVKDGSFLFNFLYKKAILNSAGMIFQSEKIKFSFKNFNKNTNKTNFICLNPVRSDFIKRLQQERNLKPFNKKNILFLGRLESQKNPMKCIEIFKEIHNFDKNYSLRMIGDGSLKSKIKKKISTFNLDLKKSIEIFQYNSEIFSELFSAELLLITSEYEGLSNTMLEKLFLNGNVLISNKIHLPDTLSSNRNIFIYNSEWDNLKIAQHYLDLISNFESQNIIDINKQIEYFHHKPINHLLNKLNEYSK